MARRRRQRRSHTSRRCNSTAARRRGRRHWERPNRRSVAARARREDRRPGRSAVGPPPAARRSMRARAWMIRSSGRRRLGCLRSAGGGRSLRGPVEVGTAPEGCAQLTRIGPSRQARARAPSGRRRHGPEEPAMSRNVPGLSVDVDRVGAARGTTDVYLPTGGAGIDRSSLPVHSSRADGAKPHDGIRRTPAGDSRSEGLGRRTIRARPEGHRAITRFALRRIRRATRAMSQR